MLRKMLILALLLELTACTQGTLEIPAGSELFANYCSACHGVLGEGDGPVASVMQVSVPNLRTLSERSDGSFPAEAVSAYVDGRNLPVSHGDRYMPVWGNVFRWSEESVPEAERQAQLRIAALVEFLETIQH